MIDKFVGAAAALFVGLWGAFTAYLFLTNGCAAAALAFLVPAIVGLGADQFGRAKLWRHPRGASRWLELWVLWPASLAAVTTAALVVLKARLDDWHAPGLTAAVTSDQNKVVIDAISTTIAAFLGAIILKAAADADEEWTGPHFRDVVNRFFRAVDRPGAPNRIYEYDPATKPGLDQALNSDEFGGASGWGFSARRKRARIISKAIK